MTNDPNTQILDATEVVKTKYFSMKAQKLGNIVEKPMPRVMLPNQNIDKLPFAQIKRIKLPIMRKMKFVRIISSGCTLKIIMVPISRPIANIPFNPVSTYEDADSVILRSLY